MSEKIIVPAQNRILAKMIYTHKINNWLFLPDTDKKKNYSVKATVEAIGAGICLDGVKLGDTVIFKPGVGEFTFNTIKINHDSNETYVVLQESDILAKEEDNQIIPLNGYAFCQRYIKEEKSNSGIIISQDKNKEDIKEGKLIKTKLIRSDIQELKEIPIDTTLYVSFFYTFHKDNQEYQFMQEEDIWLIS